MFVVALGVASLGCGASSTRTEPADRGAAVALAASEDRGATFAWMVGAWVTGDDPPTREAWFASGDHLVGVSRRAGPNGPSHELLRLDASGYTAAPPGQAITRFATASAVDGAARFENPQHDFPRWIRYRREGDALTAAIGNDDAPAATWEFRSEGVPEVRAEQTMQVCRDAEGLRVTLEGCTCPGELACAALEGELIVALYDDGCDACITAEARCAGELPDLAEGACEPRRSTVLMPPHGVGL